MNNNIIQSFRDGRDEMVHLDTCWCLYSPTHLGGKYAVGNNEVKYIQRGLEIETSL